jgi:hypothetical protein
MSVLWLICLITSVVACLIYLLGGLVLCCMFTVFWPYLWLGCLALVCLLVRWYRWVPVMRELNQSLFSYSGRGPNSMLFDWGNWLMWFMLLVYLLVWGSVCIFGLKLAVVGPGTLVPISTSEAGYCPDRFLWFLVNTDLCDCLACALNWSADTDVCDVLICWIVLNMWWGNFRMVIGWACFVLRSLVLLIGFDSDPYWVSNCGLRKKWIIGIRLTKSYTRIGLKIKLGKLKWKLMFRPIIRI